MPYAPACGMPPCAMASARGCLTATRWACVICSGVARKTSACAPDGRAVRGQGRVGDLVGGELDKGLAVGAAVGTEDQVHPIGLGDVVALEKLQDEVGRRVERQAAQPDDAAGADVDVICRNSVGARNRQRDIRLAHLALTGKEHLHVPRPHVAVIEDLHGALRHHLGQLDVLQQQQRRQQIHNTRHRNQNRSGGARGYNAWRGCKRPRRSAPAARAAGACAAGHRAAPGCGRHDGQDLCGAGHRLRPTASHSCASLAACATPDSRAVAAQAPPCARAHRFAALAACRIVGEEHAVDLPARPAPGKPRATSCSVATNRSRAAARMTRCSSCSLPC